MNKAWFGKWRFRMLVTTHGRDQWGEGETGRHMVSFPLRFWKGKWEDKASLTHTLWPLVSGTWFIKHRDKDQLLCSNQPQTIVASSKMSGTNAKSKIFKPEIERGMLHYFNLQITSWLYSSGKKGCWFWHPTPNSSKHSKLFYVLLAPPGHLTRRPTVESCFLR